MRRKAWRPCRTPSVAEKLLATLSQRPGRVNADGAFPLCTATFATRTGTMVQPSGHSGLWKVKASTFQSVICEQGDDSPTLRPHVRAPGIDPHDAASGMS